MQGRDLLTTITPLYTFYYFTYLSIFKDEAGTGNY